MMALDPKRNLERARPVDRAHFAVDFVSAVRFWIIELDSASAAFGASQPQRKASTINNTAAIEPKRSSSGMSIFSETKRDRATALVIRPTTRRNVGNFDHRVVKYLILPLNVAEEPLK